MKRIIYFVSIVSVLALYSCAGQYDNIDQYATDETIYVGKYDDMPTVRIGHNRVEIDFFSDSVGRIASDDIYLGKSTKTVVEYDEPDSTCRCVFPGVRSWVNITGLTTPKTYIFRIYTEDDYGNKSIPVEALGKPFTDDELEGYSFPWPYSIPSPTTMEFRWTAEAGLSSSLFKFVEVEYSYTDREGELRTGKLTSEEDPRFSITDLLPSENIPIAVACRIIPIMESGQIIDTVTLTAEFTAKTATVEEYLEARSLRPITSAEINPDNTTEATITLGSIPDHLAWTNIRYVHSDGSVEEVQIGNSQTTLHCPNIKRGEKIQIQCVYNPPLTNDVIPGEWTEVGTFMLKYYRDNWTIVPRTGNHSWGDGRGSQTDWDDGSPMLMLDDDMQSGWHSILWSTMPQVLIVDMKETKSVSQVIISNRNRSGYWNTIQLYLADDLLVSGYVTYTIDWSVDKSTRIGRYNDWVNSMRNVLMPNNIVPAVVTSRSPIAEVVYKRLSNDQPFILPQTLQGRFLIIVFPDNESNGGHPYIDVENLEVYSE